MTKPLVRHSWYDYVIDLSLNKQLAVYLFVLALVLRLAVLGLTFRGNEAVYYFDDGRIALNLIRGAGYSIDFRYRNWLFYEVFLKDKKLTTPITEGVKPTASKQPAYPLLLALLFRCFGTKNFLAVFILHALLSSLTS